MNQDFFLVSSFDPVPRRYLVGYCFQDEDLVLGNEGYVKYWSIRKNNIQSGQDGAYIVVSSSGDEIVIGTDFSGYFKLFLYEQAGGWAVSNSLIGLAQFAASKNLPVTVDETHLSSFFMRGTFGRQLTSLHTCIKEIKLVPSTREIVIKRLQERDSVRLRPTAAISRMAQMNDHADGLREFMGLWTSRMATILQSDLHVTCDLSGGRDSRAVFSLMLTASRRFGGDLLQNVRFQSASSAKADYAVATRIAEEYGLTLGGSRANLGTGPTLSTAEAYDRWKSLSLGIYTPIYIPRRNRSSAEVNFGGGGGEGHRLFYEKSDPKDFINQHQAHVPSRIQFRKLRAEILEDLALLSEGPEAKLDPLILHYRHFRDRCHGGCFPQYANKVAPLASGSLRAASNLCSPTMLDRSQILADILLNADEKLAFLPYDDPKKSLDAQHVAAQVDASQTIVAARNDGRVFAANDVQREAADFDRFEVFRMLCDDFLLNYERVRGTGLFPRSYLEAARTTVEEAARNGSLGHATNGCSISHVILAGELSQLSTGRRSLLERLMFWSRL